MRRSYPRRRGGCDVALAQSQQRRSKRCVRKRALPIKDVKAALLQCGWDAGMQNPHHAIHVCCPIGDLSITELIELNEGFKGFCSVIGDVVVGGWVWGMC